MTNGRDSNTYTAVPDWVYMADTPPEPWPAPRELHEQRRTWLDVVLLALAFAAGLAVGWAVR